MPETMMMPLFLGLILVILLVLAFMHLKDKEQAKRARSYEKSIEDLHRQLHAMQKKIKEKDLNVDDPVKSMPILVQREVKEELNRSLSSLLDSVRSVEQSIDSHKEQFEERLMLLEEKIKEFSYFPGSTSHVDEHKILQMFEGGWSIEHIARELRIPKEEVDFTLRLANIKK